MPDITIISGGTATNELVPLFLSLSNKVCYILPISDNGGSTSELIRFIGGPAIGDIRSRLTRLIQDDALRALLSYRLPEDRKEAKSQWNQLVEGTHPLWAPINNCTKEIFRSFLIHVNVELVKRSKSYSTHRQFRHELANVGNLFLTGVRLFVGLLDSAIEMFMKLSGISCTTSVLPCINTNFTYHISAVLQSGLVITGQSQISHPSISTIYPPPLNQTRPSTPSQDFQFDEIYSGDSDSEEESGNVPLYTHPDLKKSQLHFNKSENIEPLLSPIQRVFYVSPYGQEICPTADPKVVSTLALSGVVIYLIGLLMTSIVPVIILKGVGKALAHDTLRRKILLLNGSSDRETFGMGAVDFVRVIVELALYSMNSSDLQIPWNNLLTHIIYMKDSIYVDTVMLEGMGIKCVEVTSVGSCYYDLDDLRLKLEEIIDEPKEHSGLDYQMNRQFQSVQI